MCSIKSIYEMCAWYSSKKFDQIQCYQSKIEFEKVKLWVKTYNRKKQTNKEICIDIQDEQFKWS